jgi:hypothetical protein
VSHEKKYNTGSPLRNRLGQGRNLAQDFEGLMDFDEEDEDVDFRLFAPVQGLFEYETS